jgi:hypothetical protein
MEKKIHVMMAGGEEKAATVNIQQRDPREVVY